MKNQIFVNDRKHALEITKTFSKKASMFGSLEYKELRNAKLQNPSYRVVIKSTPKKRLEDRISMNDIEMYIFEHGGNNCVEMKALLELRGLIVNEDGSKTRVNESASFPAIKKWFFATYSELTTKERDKAIQTIIAEAAKNSAPAST